MNKYSIETSNMQVNPGEPSFYYHSDHLGSASFLTDETGTQTQQLVYLPFGEDWVDMKYNTQQFDTPYKFNGKEKDQETGYNNYGARYYYDWASIWLSVDPMSDKYPHLTSYNYCANNPVMLIDPDGRDIYVFNEDGSYAGNTKIIKQKGEHVGRILGGKGKNDIDFKFADPVHDPKDIYDGKIIKANIMSDKSVNAALSNSGVFDKKNQENKYSYILSENNNNVKQGAKMDYVATANFNDGKGAAGLYGGDLYIVKTKSGYTGHNANNFGNFLFGAGARALGFGEITTRLGGHLNNYFNDPDNQGKSYTIPCDPQSYKSSYRRTYDSKDDQFSISTGFQWMRERGK